MGAQKKKAKFIAKGNLNNKIKQRNVKKKFEAMKSKKKNRFERNSDAPTKKKLPTPADAGHQNKKDENDMMDEMDVDDFLNADFLDSDDNASDFEQENDAGSDSEKDDDDVAGDDSSSEEEDEDALDPRYMAGITPFKGDDDDEDDEAEDQAADDDDTPMDGEAAEEEDDPTGGRITLTMAELVKAEKGCFAKHSASGLRKIMKMFSDACRSSDAADVNKEGDILYDIQSSAVYNRLMLSVFRKTHVSFAKLVMVPSEDGAAKVDEKRWKRHALLIRRFFSASCYLLEQTTGQDVQLFVLRELVHYIPFLTPCPKTARRLLKALLKLWAKSLNTNVCMLAFVRIRDLALKMPFPFLEMALKGIYVTYMRNTKFTNEATLPHHVLLGNCVVELYGLDFSSSYQHSFIYIRQLAIAIRKTITSPSPDTFKAVLNWQFFNQLRVWTAVVCAYPAENQLRALVYPLCQLLFAVVRLSSTVKYSPLRFHCVKLLQQIAFATNSFVPTSPALLEVLNMAPFDSSYKSVKSAKGKDKNNTRLELDLDLCVKLAKSTLENKRAHDYIITRLFELLQRECDVYKFHIGFPEFAVPLQLTLKKFASTCSIPKWKSLARGLSENIQKRSDWIRSKRSGLDVCPKDVEKLDAFLKNERENAVQKLFEHDAEELNKKIATTQKKAPEAAPKATKAKKEYNSDESGDEADSEKPAENAAGEEGEAKKKKKKRRHKLARRVDAETVQQVSKMSLNEFKKNVAAMDVEDEVQDFAFSDDE